MNNRTELDILGTKWALLVGELRPDSTGRKLFGFMDAEVREITINQETDPSWRLYLLLHEVLHALSFMGHLQFLKREDFRHIDDEAKVDAVASLISDVLIRNDLANTAMLGTEPREGVIGLLPRYANRVSRKPRPSASVAAKGKP